MGKEAELKKILQFGASKPEKKIDDNE